MLWSPEVIVLEAGIAQNSRYIPMAREQSFETVTSWSKAQDGPQERLIDYHARYELEPTMCVW
jgi:hypothetical protein